MSNITITKAALLFSALTIIIYGNTFLNTWTFDDIGMVTDPAATSFSGFLKLQSFDRALRFLTHIPEYKLFGYNPIGYRIQQLFWHTANSFLIFLILAKIGIPKQVAIISTIFFIVHPLQTETVASIGHRKELLALFFILASFLSYIKALATEQKQYRYLLLSFLLFGIALTANLTIMTFPIILIGYELLLLPKEKRLLAKNLPFLAIIITIASAGVLYKFWGFFSVQQRMILYSQNNFFENYRYYPAFWGAIKAFSIYILHILVPINLTPEFTIKINNSILPLSSVPGLLLFFITTAAAFYFRKKNPNITFAIIWFLALYAPISNFIPAGYIVADRYMYICLPAICLFVSPLLKKSKQAIYYAIIILVLFSTLTIRQNTFWRDSITLWNHAISICPTSTGAHLLLATTYFENGEFIKAKTHAETVVKLNSFLPYSHYILGMIAYNNGDLKAAKNYFETFLISGKQATPEKYYYVKKILYSLKTNDKETEGEKKK